jgi:hypothetical protein
LLNVTVVHLRGYSRHFVVNDLEFRGKASKFSTKRPGPILLTGIVTGYGALDGKVMDRHPYSPDLAPRDSHLFGPLKKHLAGERVVTDADVKQDVASWLRTLVDDFFYPWAQALVRCWDKCLNVNGDNVEV